MKLLRKVLLFLFIFLVVSGVGGYFYMHKKFEPAANQLVVTGLPITSAFVWYASKTPPVVPHAALLIPVTLPNCPRPCYFQFDTGAPTSLLYANTLAALREQYPAAAKSLLPQADTVYNFEFALGQGKVQARRLRALAHGASALSADGTTPTIIGTLGNDVLDGRVLVLDYRRQRFSLLSQVPDSLSRQTDFVPLNYASRRLILDAQVQGKPCQLLFDSGSSAFSLLTSPTIWQQMARPEAAVTTVKMNALSRKLTAHTAPTEAALQVSNTTLPLRTVTYMEGTDLMENMLMRFSGMEGMLGNESFSQRTIVLDVKGGRFGVVRQ